MKPLNILIFSLFFSLFANGQTTFSPVDSKLTLAKNNNEKQIICSYLTTKLKFQIKRNISVLSSNLVMVDSQTIQITPLKIGGLNFDSLRKDINKQKTLLTEYSKYEMDYYKNELGLELISPNSQWIISKTKGWKIWYFKVGYSDIQVDKKVAIQLFASTIINDKIVTINAPIFIDEDFKKAAYIVNEFIESLKIEGR